jgi:hypothetical protein
MGVGFARAQLVYRINDAFDPDKIAATADSVATLPPGADTFDILHSLGLFQFPPGLELDAYRRSLPIPELNKQAMTASFQASVKGKIPLSSPSWPVIRNRSRSPTPPPASSSS